MGKSNQQRRAARAKQRHRRGPTPASDRVGANASPFGAGWPGFGADGFDPDLFDPDLFDPETVEDVAASPWRRPPDVDREAAEMLQRLARWAALNGSDGLSWAVRTEISGSGAAVLTATEGLLVAELTARVARAWEDGWQPRDLMHLGSKKHARVAGLTGDLILHQARLTTAGRRAPEPWLAQLRNLGFDSEIAGSRWRPLSELGTDLIQQVQPWVDLLVLLKMLADLTPLQPLGPRPSQWGRRTPASTVRPSTDRDRLMTRIRALLAKAEATDYAAEAEVFTAKAQELMTRHAIDEAVLRSEQQEDVEVQTRRVHLLAPYAQVKALLLGAVGRPNRSRVIFHDAYDMCSLVGTPLDVDQVEMLFTSLLIQATRAMAEAGHRRAGSFDRSATFRRSFLTAYATRIGERLQEADRETASSYGTGLVPVLQREAEAIDAEFVRLFPHTRTMNTGHLDQRGWQAGRAAADQATFTAGRLTA